MLTLLAINQIQGFHGPKLVDGCQTKLSSVETYIVSRNECVRIVRRLLYDKSTISVFILIIIAEWLLNKGSLLQVMPNFSGCVLLCGIGTLIWTLFYAAFGPVIWIAAQRNIPVIMSGFVFCLGTSGLLVVLFIFILGHLQPFDLIVSELFNVSVMMTLGMIVTLIAHQDSLLKQLNTEQRAFPIWQRTYVNDLKQDEVIPAILRETILYIQTSNQYIEVNTSLGKHELRMSLTKAETYLDETIGTRVHRSHWVRNTEMKALTYKNGNPFIELHSGGCLPIGRNMVDPVKEIITSQV